MSVDQPGDLGDAGGGDADVLERHAGEGDHVAVVSHGTVIALLLEHASGRNGFELWRRMQLPSFAVLDLPGFEMREVVERVEGG